MIDFCLQYTLFRSRLCEIRDRLHDALDEDHLKNADMFDITRTTFSQSKHPNATMRALEKELCAAEPLFLYLLFSLTELGMEITQGLVATDSPESLARIAAETYRDLQKRAPSAAFLAQSLTEIKAEHALKRLTAAMRIMDHLR